MSEFYFDTIEEILNDIFQESISYDNAIKNCIKLQKCFVIPVKQLEPYGRSSIGYLILPLLKTGYVIQLYGSYGLDNWCVWIDNGIVNKLKRQNDLNKSPEEILNEYYPDFKLKTYFGYDSAINNISQEDIINNIDFNFFI